MIVDSEYNRVKGGDFSDFTEEQHRSLPLLAEVPGLLVDLEKLNWHLENVVKKEPALYITRDEDRKMRYGGWSVTSVSGHVHDGWQSTSGWKTIDADGNGTYSDLLAFQAGYRPRWFSTKKTPICTGYLNEVVDMITDMGFYPKSIRIWDNPPGGYHIGQHTDGPSEVYCVRLHIPIVTNPDCVHTWYTAPEPTSLHIPADGRGHLFRTNISHDTFNHGSTQRFHLIAEVWDTKGLVPGFKYDTISAIRKNANNWLLNQTRKAMAQKLVPSTNFTPDSTYSLRMVEY